MERVKILLRASMAFGPRWCRCLFDIESGPSAVEFDIASLIVCSTSKAVTSGMGESRGGEGL